MLASRELDDQRYADIVQEAKGRLPWLCPAWTDHNAHDPGITIIELMAWYKEMQQYHMDQVTPAIQSRLLALAGGRARPAQPARCAVEVGADCPAQRELARLTNRQGVAFELTEPIPAIRAALDRVLVESHGERRDVTNMLGQSFRPFSFGDGESSALLLGFGALPEGELRLWFAVEEPAGSRRFPADSQTPPPRVLAWERVGLGPAEPVRDDTWALSRSGYVVFAPEDGWSPGEDALYWLRVRLVERGCEERVRLSGVSAGRYEAAQQETRSRCRYYRLEDRADRRVLLTSALAQWGDLAVFLREDAGWRQVVPEGDEAAGGGRTLTIDGRGSAQDGGDNLLVVCLDPLYLPSLLFDFQGRPGESLYLDLRGQRALEGELLLLCDTLERDGQVRPALWRCVEDLTVCGPRDRVFTYDPIRETVTFGDGLRGAVPAAGEGAVLAANLVLSRCGGGNIPANAHLTFVQGGIPVENTAAAGGRDRETVQEVRGRLLRELGTTKKCLSAQDFEDRAMETPGLRLAAARALPGCSEQTAASRPAVVTVVVLPASDEPRPQPDRRFLAAVRRQLERCRPICVQVHVTGPRYVPLSLAAQLWVENGGARPAAEQALAEFLAVSRERIGETVRRDGAAACLQAVPGVLAVRRLEVRSMGAGGYRTAGGDIQLPPDAIPYWGEVELELVRS
ncbi:MAG: hypothetical protein HFF73_03655 [Oscillospiraceae bacterium]|nr:hypothetical protein [Oscillospiraceae bacterium]